MSSADNIKRRHAEDSSWVVNAGLLENGGNDWNGWVGRVRDHEDVSLWGDTGNCSSKVTDDGSISVSRALEGIVQTNEKEMNTRQFACYEIADGGDRRRWEVPIYTEYEHSRWVILPMRDWFE